MLRKFIWFFLLLPAGAVLVALAVANRHMVRLTLDPFSPTDPALALEAPFFLFLFAALIVGLLIGAAVTWFGQRRWRRAAKRRSAEAAGLKRETERLNRQLEVARQPQISAASASD